MSTQTITPITIFSDLLDGYSASRLAGLISHVDNEIGTKMAEKALSAFSKKQPTPQEQKDVHEVLQWVFDGESACDLVQEYGINDEDAEAYVVFIRSDYAI